MIQKLLFEAMKIKMYTKTKTVFYCSFCRKKHTLTERSILDHEGMCFENPDRHCPKCGKSQKYINEMVTELLEENNDCKISFDRMLEYCCDYFENCECCIKYFFWQTNILELVDDVYDFIFFERIIDQIQKNKCDEFRSIVGHVEV